MQTKGIYMIKQETNCKADETRNSTSSVCKHKCLVCDRNVLYDHCVCDVLESISRRHKLIHRALHLSKRNSARIHSKFADDIRAIA